MRQEPLIAFSEPQNVLSGAYFLKKTKKKGREKKIRKGRISRGSQNFRGYGAISQFYERNYSQIQDICSTPLGE